MKGSIWETLMETERAGGNNPGGENKRGVMDRKIVGGRAHDCVSDKGKWTGGEKNDESKE